MRRHRILVALAIVAPAVASLLAFGDTLAGGLLSDDYLLNVYRLRGGDGLGVDWSVPFADLARPWLGFGAPFYRPLLSFTFAIDLARGGADPTALHQTNLLLHALVTSAGALLCALHAPAPRRALAALLGGVLIAVHPVAVEPVAWIAARNSGLEVAVRTLALAAFAVHLRSRSRASGIASFTFAALALSAKESAIVLPVAFVALDLLHRPRRRLRERAVLHARYVPLWVGYAGLRIALLGTFAGDGGSAGPRDAATLASNALGKVAALLTPHLAARTAAFDAVTIIGVAAGAALLALALARRPALTLVALGWAALDVAPTFALRMQGGFGGSRLIYGALPALAVATCALPLRTRGNGAAGARTPLWLAVLVALFAATLVPLARSRSDDYRQAWSAMRAATAELAPLAAAASRDHPLAIAAMPQATAPGLPPCNPNAWFPFVERPQQPVDAPMVSLGFVTVEVPGSESLLGDPGTVRALRAAGATIASWDAANDRFLTRGPTPAPTALPPLRTTPEGGIWRARFATAVDAEAVEQVTIVAELPAGSNGDARLSWFTLDPNLPLPYALEGVSFAVPTAGPADHRATLVVDLTRELGPTALATIGLPIQGFVLRLPDGARLLELTAESRLPELPAPFPAAAAALDFADLAAAFRAPAELAAGTRLRLALLDPMSAHVIEISAGVPLAFDDRLRTGLATALRLSRAGYVACYLEARAPQGRAGHARSPLVALRLTGR
ncbi:MAG: hypothetical protein IPM29_02685 [Planctomycetes bacterium]|nr:hypothetical protein [Planctomycetota bacterium]